LSDGAPCHKFYQTPIIMAYATTERPSASHYSRYDDGLDSEEEEEERRLSEQFGEVEEADGTNKRKRSSTNAETKLTEEDAAAAKQFEEEVRLKTKKVRPTLQEKDLKSSKGLIFIRRSFPTQVQKYRHVPLTNKVRGTGSKSNKLAQKMNTNAHINAAATYSRSLMGAYREFANELFSSMAPEDVFLKIDQLHSKKDIKDYLQLMRDEFRKEYMEGIYGGEKANRILNEMEYGLKVHPVETEENGYVEEEPAARMMTRMGYAAATEDSDGEGEKGNAGDNGETETPPASPLEPVVNPYASNVTNNVETNAPENEAGVESNVDSNPNANGAAEDDEEEAEATFEDDNMDKDGKNNGEEEKVGEESDEDMENDELEFVAKESDKNEVETECQENNDKVVEDMEEKNNDVEEANTQETLTLKESEIKTQESLTLMASQFDDDDMEFTQDDRFSQVSMMGGVTTETEKPAQPKQAEFEEEDDFSQTERFSQFTQTQTTGPVFEMDDNAEGEDGEEEDADQLGQTMGDAALSMEY
jgi:hypothetical protein